MKTTGKGLIASGVLVAVMAVISAWGWLGTPDGAQIAVHWNASGEPDRYGGKLEAFTLMPVLAVLLSAIFAAAPLIDPRGHNLARSGPVLLAIWIGTLLLLTAVQAVLTLGALGLIDSQGEGAPRLVLLAACILIAVLGNVLGKARPNWFVGVRTPWTLSSDKAWDITHRGAGRGFVISALAGGAALGLGSTVIGVSVLTGLLLATVGACVVLSFFVWRSDPERETFNEPA